MQATDEQWLKGKKDWLPIEIILNDLAPGLSTAKEQIDALSFQLDAQTVRDLHYLRMQRNRMMHDGLAISNMNRWNMAAGNARAKLEVIQARQHTAAREAQLQAQAKPKPSTPAKPTVTVVQQPASTPSSWALYAVMLLKIAAWCAGSWYLHSGVMYVLTSVNIYSAAWWVLQAVGVLCWPGIAATYVLYAFSVALMWVGETVFDACVWLVKYIIANPY